MPDIDLEPHEYGEKGRKEPILHPNWKWGLVGLAVFIGFRAVIYGASLIGQQHH